MAKHFSFTTNLFLSITAAAAAYATPAAAADWRYYDTQRPRAVDTWNFMVGSDDALWTFAIDGVRRTDAAGVTSAVLGLPPNMSAPQFDAGLPLADGGAILVDLGNGCRIARVDRTLRRLWQQSVPGHCIDVTTTPDGHVWASDARNAYFVNRDGVAETTIALGNAPTNSPEVRLAVTSDGGLVVAAGDSTSLGGTLRHYRRDGTLRWSYSNPSLRFDAILVAPDDSTFLTGILPTFGSSIGDVTALRFDARGTLQWTYASTGALYRIVEAALTTEGALQILSEQFRVGTPGSLHTLHRIGNGGALAWSRDVCEVPTESFFAAHFALLPGGSTALVCPGDGAHYVRLDAAGASRLTAPLPVDAVRPLRLRRDGTLQTRGWTRANPEHGRMFAIDTDGRVIDTPATAPIAAEARLLLDTELARDGASYLLTQAALSTERFLSKVDANGAFAWRYSLPPNLGIAQLSVARTRVCLTAQAQSNLVSVTCLSTADGTVSWSREIPRKSSVEAPSKSWPPPPYVLAAAALDDGTVTLVQSNASDHEFVRFDANGVAVVDVTKPGVARSIAFDGTGRATLSLGVTDGPPQLVQYDRDGNRRSIGAAASAPGAFDLVEGSTADDGSVLAIGRANAASATGPAELWSIGADGNLAWRYAYDSQARSTAIVRAQDAIYLVEDQSYAGVDGPGTTRITRLAPRTGTSVWRVVSTDAIVHAIGGRFAVSADGATGVLVDGGRERLRVQRYATDDGARLDTSYAACTDYCGQAQALALDADGGARVALDVADRTRGRTAAVFALPAVAARRAAIRVDQSGITGAWWAPYANGEGFVLDFLPTSRTLFMPWFTFSREGGNDTSGQRWYVIQGAAPAGATSVTLPITDTTGGNFDDGPAVTPRIVGTATLRFTDCSNGTLTYAFNAGENGGATGTITLSRLSPATEPCVLADGTTQPGAGARPAADGFDARMSGSWFEPATAGQGLQLVVQPGGLFFAPWFTYDPAGPSDDPGRQRWYTLQGTLAGARDGTVTAPIVQTVGGAFDSVPTDNMAIVGTSTLTFSGCDRATLRYRFDDSDAAGALRGRSGSIDLVKIGGCTPQ